MIPEEAVEAAAEEVHDIRYGWLSRTWEECLDDTKVQLRIEALAALEAAAPHVFQELLDFADERDEALGAIRSHITTCELRKLLGVEE